MVNIYTLAPAAALYGLPGAADEISSKGTITRRTRYLAPNSLTVDLSAAPCALPLNYTDTHGLGVLSNATGGQLTITADALPSGYALVYALATPTTETIAAQSILALSGQTLVTSDAASVTVGVV